MSDTNAPTSSSTPLTTRSRRRPRELAGREDLPALRLQRGELVGVATRVATTVKDASSRANAWGVSPSSVRRCTARRSSLSNSTRPRAAAVPRRRGSRWRRRTPAATRAAPHTTPSYPVRRRTSAVPSTGAITGNSSANTSAIGATIRAESRAVPQRLEVAGLVRRVRVRVTARSRRRTSLAGDGPAVPPSRGSQLVERLDHDHEPIITEHRRLEGDAPNEPRRIVDDHARVRDTRRAPLSQQEHTRPRPAARGRDFTCGSTTTATAPANLGSCCSSAHIAAASRHSRTTRACSNVVIFRAAFAVKLGRHGTRSVATVPGNATGRVMAPLPVVRVPGHAYRSRVSMTARRGRSHGRHTYACWLVSGPSGAGALPLLGRLDVDS